jgi:shikimate kinase
MNLPSTIALIGYRGTGKTTVARLLASRLHCDWIDADVEIERRAGKSIAAIFEESGESAFRDLESQVVADLCERRGMVVSLGGGAVLREENRQCLARQCSGVIWLKASADTIEKRLATDATTSQRRPNLTNRGGRTEIEALLEQREPIYRACATLEVDTDNRDPAELAAEIASALGRPD